MTMDCFHFAGTFFLPRDQQHDKPKKETNYEGLAYLGEYALAWSACLNNESIYNLLVEKGANPDAQDNFGNTVLHMVVVANQMVINDYWTISIKMIMILIRRECMAMP